MKKEANPIPQGKYVPANRFENLIFTAGMTPRVNGVLMQTGTVRAEVPLEEYRNAVRQAAKNALTAAGNKLTEGERIGRILSITENLTDINHHILHTKTIKIIGNNIAAISLSHSIIIERRANALSFLKNIHSLE